MTSAPSEYSANDGYPRHTWLTIRGFSLVLGVIVGLAATTWVINRSQPPTPTPTSPPSTTLLLLGVDSMKNSQPQIEAVWLMTIAPNYQVIELMGLPPGPYRNMFTPGTGLTQDVLQARAGGTILGTIVFDHSDLVELTDALGGGWLKGERVDGTGVDGYLKEADPAQTKDVLVRQAAVIQGLVAQMAIRGHTLDLGSLITAPSLITIDEGKLRDLMLHCSPITTAKIIIRVRADGL